MAVLLLVLFCVCDAVVVCARKDIIDAAEYDDEEDNGRDGDGRDEITDEQEELEAAAAVGGVRSASPPLFRDAIVEVDACDGGKNCSSD